MSIINIPQKKLLESNFAPNVSLFVISVNANTKKTLYGMPYGLSLNIGISFDQKLNSLIDSITNAKEPYIKSLLNNFKFKFIICETEQAAERYISTDFFSYIPQRNTIINTNGDLDGNIFSIENFFYDPSENIYRLSLQIFTDRPVEQIEYLSVVHGFYIDLLEISQKYSLSSAVSDLLSKNYFSNKISNLEIIKNQTYVHDEKTRQMNYIEILDKATGILPIKNTPTSNVANANPYFSNLFANFSEFSYPYYSKTVSFTFLKYAFFFDADRFKIENCAFPEIAKAFGDEERRRFLGSDAVSTAYGRLLGSFYRKRVDIPNEPEELIAFQLNNFSETKDYKATTRFYEFINDKLTSLDGIYFFSGIDSLNKERTEIETGSPKKITAGTYQYRFLGIFNDPIYIILQDLLNKLQNDKRTLSEYNTLAKIPQKYNLTNLFFTGGSYQKFNYTGVSLIDDPHVIDNIVVDGNYNPITSRINSRLSNSFSSRLDTVIENYIKVWLLLKNIEATQEEKSKNIKLSSTVRNTLKLAIKPGTGDVVSLSKFINGHDKIFAILKEKYNSKSPVPFSALGYPGTSPIKIEETFKLKIKADVKEHFGFKFLNENNLNHRYGVPQVDFNAIKSNIPLNSVYFADDRKSQEVTIDLISTITTGSATDLDNKILKNIKRDNVPDKAAVLSFKADAINLAKTNNLGRSFTSNKAYDKQFKKEADAKTNNQVFASVITSYQAIILGSDAYTKLNKDTSVVVKYYSFGRDTITGEYILKDARLNALTAEQPNGKYFCILEQSGSFPRDYTGAPIFDKYFIVDKK